MKKNSDTLDELRKDLQELDMQLLLLILERYKISIQMGKEKRLLKIGLFQETEWNRKVSFLSDNLKGNPRIKEVLEIFYFIHNQSLKLQENLNE